MDSVIIIALTALLVLMPMTMRIAKENERFAMFAFGRFVRLKGPGLVLKPAGTGIEFIRISLGSEAEVQSNEYILLDEYPIPYIAEGRVRSGSKVRVSGFNEHAVRVELLNPNYLVCEKCGHKNAL